MFEIDKKNLKDPNQKKLLYLNCDCYLSYSSFSSFQFLRVLLLFSESWSTTTRGVHPSGFQGQLISFHLGALDLFLQ